jgi:hypothetical protein
LHQGSFPKKVSAGKLHRFLKDSAECPKENQQGIQEETKAGISRLERNCQTSIELSKQQNLGSCEQETKKNRNMY